MPKENIIKSKQMVLLTKSQIEPEIKEVKREKVKTLKEQLLWIPRRTGLLYIQERTRKETTPKKVEENSIDPDEERILSNSHSSTDSDQEVKNSVSDLNMSSSLKIQNTAFDTIEVFDKVNEVVVISESEASSEAPYWNNFSTSLLDIYKLNKVNGDRNCLFRTLWKSTFGDDSMHLTVRQNICDYIIQNKARFKDFMEDDVDVTEYIAKMLLDGEWGGHVEACCFFWAL